LTFPSHTMPSSRFAKCNTDVTFDSLCFSNPNLNAVLPSLSFLRQDTPSDLE